MDKELKRLSRFIIIAGSLVLFLEIVMIDILGIKMQATHVLTISLLTVVLYTHIKDLARDYKVPSEDQDDMQNL